MKLLYILAPALLASTSVFAADLETYQPEATIYSWTGGYIGVNAGGGFGDFEHPVVVSDPTGTIAEGLVDLDAGGFLGGAQIGYNWQTGSVIFGVEADIQAANIEATPSLSIAIPAIGENIEGDAGTTVDWFGTLRARVGFAAADRFMLYGTGGAAYGRVESSVTASTSAGTLIDESASDTRWGWTIGAGGEYAITDNISFKSEYLYTDLGSENVIDADFGGVNASLDSDVAFHTVRVGLNYRF